MQNIKTPLPVQKIKQNEIHVWTAHTAEWVKHLPELKSLLSQDELARCNRFVFDHLKVRFAIAHGLLRLLIAAYLVQEPSSIEFEHTSKGKPFLKNRHKPPFLHFNMSHSHEGIAYAFANNAEVGVDIELCSSKDSLESLAQNSLTENELQGFHRLEEPLKHQRFFQLWTCKEAILKATGEGFSVPLKQIDLGSNIVLPCIYHCDKEARQWSLYPLKSLPGYTGAIAIEGSNWQLTSFRLIPEV